jgi:methylenetetrahydrofolate reductase (NADPH)
MSTRENIKSKLAETLADRRLAVLAELTPLQSAEALDKAAADLPQSLDAVIVSDGGFELQSCALAAAALLIRKGREPVLSLATRDRNRIALYSDVLGAAALGILNILCFSGHHQAQGDYPQAARVFDLDSVQLLQGLQQMRNLPNEKLSGTCPPLFLGAMAHPFLQPQLMSSIDLQKKTDAGAQFFLTDPIFDLTAFRSWMHTMSKEIQCPVIVNVKPLESREEAEQIRTRQRSVSIPDDMLDRLTKAEHPAEEGLALCAEIAQEAATIEGVRGISIACGKRSDIAVQMIERASLQRK